jgi:hypothetical protein
MASAEVTETETTLAEFKAQVTARASVGHIGGRLFEKDGN